MQIHENTIQIFVLTFPRKQIWRCAAGASSRISMKVSHHGNIRITRNPVQDRIRYSVQGSGVTGTLRESSRRASFWQVHFRFLVVFYGFTSGKTCRAAGAKCQNLVSICSRVKYFYLLWRLSWSDWALNTGFFTFSTFIARHLRDAQMFVDEIFCISSPFIMPYN